MIVSSAPTVQTPIYSFNAEEEETTKTKVCRLAFSKHKNYAESSLSSILATAGKIKIEFDYKNIMHVMFVTIFSINV